MWHLIVELLILPSNIIFTNDGYLSSKHILKVLSCNEMVKVDWRELVPGCLVAHSFGSCGYDG